MVGASLAQIGEFSFILVGLGSALGLLPDAGRNLVLAAALLSIALNQLMFRAADAAYPWLVAQPWLARLARRQDPRENPLAELPLDTDRRFLSNQVVLVGWSRLGWRVAAQLREQGVPLVVADEQRERVEELRAQDLPAVWGDPALPEVLVQAHVREAAVLLVTLDDVVKLRSICDTARALNPGIRLLIHGPGDDELQRLQADFGAETFSTEAVLAQHLTLSVVQGRVAAAVKG